MYVRDISRDVGSAQKIQNGNESPYEVVQIAQMGLNFVLKTIHKKCSKKSVDYGTSVDVERI